MGTAARCWYRSRIARCTLDAVGTTECDDREGRVLAAGERAHRGSAAFASAVNALMLPTASAVWAEWWGDDGLHMYVTPSSVVRQLSDDREKIRASFAAAVRQFAGDGTDLSALLVPESLVTPRRCRTHAPPDELLSTSPNRPHGPPLPRVALDVMAAAA